MLGHFDKRINQLESEIDFKYLLNAGRLTPMVDLLPLAERRNIAVVAKYPWYLNDAKSALKDKNLNVELFESLLDLEGYLSTHPTPDYIFFPHLSSMIHSHIYSKYRCIGFHTGDLPRDRGGSPVQNKILKMEYATTVSAFEITEEVDSGPIYAQRPIDLSEGTIEEILRKISLTASDLMREIIEGNLKPYAQNGTPSYHRRLTPADSIIPIDIVSALNLYDRIRMVDGLDYPRAYLEWGKFKVTLTNAQFKDGKVSAECAFEENQTDAK